MKRRIRTSIKSLVCICLLYTSDFDDVIDVNERLLKKIFKEVLDIDVQLPMLRMTYKEAMDRFGSDKPDMRFGMELTNVSDTVHCFFISHAKHRCV